MYILGWCFGCMTTLSRGVLCLGKRGRVWWTLSLQWSAVCPWTSSRDSSTGLITSRGSLKVVIWMDITGDQEIVVINIPLQTKLRFSINSVQFEVNVINHWDDLFHEICIKCVRISLSLIPSLYFLCDYIVSYKLQIHLKLKLKGKNLGHH